MILQSYLHVSKITLDKVCVLSANPNSYTRRITITMDNGESIELTLHSKKQEQLLIESNSRI